MPTQFGSIQDNLITSNIENNKILHSNFAHKPCQWHVPVITESPDCFRPFFPRTHIDRNNGTRERCIANITEIRRYNGEIQPLLARGFLSAPLAITHLSVYHRRENPTRLITEDVEETRYAYLLLLKNEFSPFNT